MPKNTSLSFILHQKNRQTTPETKPVLNSFTSSECHISGFNLTDHLKPLTPRSVWTVPVRVDRYLRLLNLTVPRLDFLIV